MWYVDKFLVCVIFYYLFEEKYKRMGQKKRDLFLEFIFFCFFLCVGQKRVNVMFIIFKMDYILISEDSREEMGKGLIFGEDIYI